MRAVSKRRAKQNREYRPLRDAFLAERPWCEFPLGCGRSSTEVHHQKGRSGLRLLDQRFWAASCRAHNDYAETDTGHSLSIGWLLRLEAVAE